MVFWKRCYKIFDNILEKFFQNIYLYIKSNRFAIFASEDFQSHIQAKIW